VLCWTMAAATGKRMKTMKHLMTGNEGIARGAWEAGVTVVAAYPGTPSTEITENAARYPEMYAEWAPNEKVAMEVGIGASIAGARTLVAMKHVGVNVAADPLFTFAYTGVNGGLVMVSADDPGMHSSQNEQDNRHYGRAAKVPVVEPSDSQEAKDFTKEALQISEDFDTPVILRTTTRVSHSQSLVEWAGRAEVPLKEYKKDPAKFVMVPANAKKRHVVVEARLRELADFAERTTLNRVEWADRKIGVITAGITYQYVREALPQASVLKLGLVWPLPEKMIRDFAAQVETLYVIEELDPFIEDIVKSWGIPVIGKALFDNKGEIFAETIAEKILGLPAKIAGDAGEIPVRPPVMCAGCPHRGVFYVLNKLHTTVAGDIGCYTLGAAPPLSAMDTTICMGASIGTALGMEKARGRDFARHTAAVIGDSTFIHSGITGLVDVVYNQGTTTVIILDNRITAMTGHQQNPVTGRTLKGEPAPEVDLEMLCRAVGVNRVTVIDPFDLEETEAVLKRELAAEEPSVVITKKPCALIVRKDSEDICVVNPELCNGCKRCLRLGCPGLVKVEKKVAINPMQCNGCGLCIQVCPQHAIRKEGEM